MTSFRTGIGHDVHKLFPGRELVLGGVTVSNEVGFETHSDGDVLCHALIDALAGAIANGDLGTHYPEDDPGSQDARSLEFVEEFGRYVRRAGYEIANVDAFVVWAPYACDRTSMRCGTTSPTLSRWTSPTSRSRPGRTTDWGPRARERPAQRG